MRNGATPGFNWLGLPLIATVARLLCRELALQNEYLRQENKVLRSKLTGRIRFDDNERWLLVDAALAMGSKLMRQVVTIVKPETILKWQRRLEREKWDYSKRPRRPGRPRKPGEVEALVCRMARENTWGYGRIQGELAKLGITVSDSCVADILRCVVRQYKDFHNEHRPHRGIGNQIPTAKEGQAVTEINTGDRPLETHCDQWLGRLLKSYRRAA